MFNGEKIVKRLQNGRKIEELLKLALLACRIGG